MGIRWECPYCDTKFRQREELKQHLMNVHRSEMQKVAAGCQKPQTISWAAGWRAAFCGHKDTKEVE